MMMMMIVVDAIITNANDYCCFGVTSFNDRPSRRFPAASTDNIVLFE